MIDEFRLPRCPLWAAKPHERRRTTTGPTLFGVVKCEACAGLAPASCEAVDLHLSSGRTAALTSLSHCPAQSLPSRSPLRLTLQDSGLRDSRPRLHLPLHVQLVAAIMSGITW